MPRGRVLSDEGRRLLLGAYDPPEQTAARGGCLAFFRLMGLPSRYDKQVQDTVRLFRQGSEALVGKPALKDTLSGYMNNAIVNLVLQMLRDKKDRQRTLKKREAARNARFFLNVATGAMRTKDHNTAILLRSALGHSTLRRLHTKAMADKLAALDDEYGTFRTCQASHVQHVLGCPDGAIGPGKEIPSMMVLHMHEGRTREHAKAFRQIGKLPAALLATKERLSRCLETIGDKFRQSADLIPLYTEDPNVSTAALYELADQIR